MEEIERIRSLDDEVFEEFKLYFPKTTSSDFTRLYPKTNVLFSMLTTSSNFIKNSIFDGCENDDYYGTKILFRSLIEHYLRFKYLFVNFSLTKTDDFAKEYLEYNNAREVLDLIRAKVSEKQLYDVNFKIEDWNLFLNKHPGFKNKTRKEVETESMKVTFKNIIRFLNVEFKKGNLEISDYLGKLIVEYSELSSFVHGGFGSYQEMSVQSEEKRVLEYNRICGLSFQLSTSIKLFSVLTYAQTDKDLFSAHYLKLDGLLKEVGPKKAST